jgi:hypothetical protein
MTMRFARPLRTTLLCIAAVAAVGCGKDSPGVTDPDPDPPVTQEPVRTPNFVRLQSEAGDWVGAGRSYDYSQANAALTLTVQGGHVRVAIDGDQWWHADFQLPSNLSTIQVGTYTGLQRYPFNDQAKGGLDWSGDGRGCNTLTGSITVDSVTYTTAGLASLDLRFEQHCEGAAPALRGTIHWRADDKTVPPGPATPVPAGLWQPSASLPATGSYVYLQSDPGDFIGGGAVGTFAAPSVSASGGHVTVGAGGFHGDFQVMNTLTRIEPGFYNGLRRYPFHNPTRGGLSWSGNGRGCNELTGWFAVDQVTYTGTTLTSLDLRFEQHCEGGSPALHGVIHFRG